MHREEERRKALLADIAEIEQLIREWRSDTDPETQWAIQLLEAALEKRKESLRMLLR